MDKQFLNEEGLQSVADNVNKRLKTVETMPVNPKDGQIVLYVGESGMVYTQGCIYQFDENEDEWIDITSSGTVDQSFNPLSSNAQSGIAVDEAKTVLFNKLFNQIWESTTFSKQIYPINIWNDGENTYHSQAGGQYVFDESTKRWDNMSWGGTNDWNGITIWKSLSGTYYAKGDYDLRLNKSTQTWEKIEFNVYISGRNVWTDGDNTYYSDSYEQYVFSDEANLTWEEKTWQGLSEFSGRDIWTDGTSIYYSSGVKQYVLNKSTSTWEPKTWQGLTNFAAQYIWTDGTSVYYSYGSTQYVLNKATSTWEPKTWEGLTSFSGYNVWNTAFSEYYCTDSEFVSNKLSKTLKTYID